MSQPVKMFFQVVLPRTLQLGKLEIPKKFVLLYGEEFLNGNSIVLMAPNGDTWHMSLEKHDGSMTIGDGWTDFAQHYSVGDMDFITFQYKYHKQSIPVFNVLILNEPTNMEIPRYPAKQQPSSHVNDNRTRYPAKHQPSSHVNDNRTTTNDSASSFEKRQSIRNHLGMPLRFLRKAGLCNKSTLLLKGHTGVEWVVKLKRRLQVSRVKAKYGRGEHNRYQYHLGGGWKDFREHNDIDKTDKLKFQHIKGRLITVTKVV